MQLKDDLVSGVGKNSWYVKKALGACKGTLFEKIETPFFVHAFACRCGENELYVNRDEKMSHRCEQCHNSFYFDDTSMIFNTRKELLINIDLLPILEKKESYYSVKLFLERPSHIDLGRMHVRLERHMFYELQIDFQAQSRTIASYMPTEYVQRELLRYLLEFISEEIKGDIEGWEALWFNEQSLQRQQEMIAFFLRYPHIRESSLFFWKCHDDPMVSKLMTRAATSQEALSLLLGHRRERSLKRALYGRYARETIEGFDALAPCVIISLFDDVNRIRLLLEASEVTFREAGHLSFQVDAQAVTELLLLLKEYYGEAKMMTLLREVNSAYEIYEDLLRMHQEFSVQIRENFTKVSVTWESIHDEFVRCIHLKEVFEAYSYRYERVFQDAVRVQEALEFRLPKDAETLFVWSKILENCMFSYARTIYEGRSTIYGVFKEMRLLYAVEVREGVIVQMYAKKNREVPSTDKEVIERWFKDHFQAINPTTPTKYL